MKNVKVVHAKQTIMESNNSTEAVTKKQYNRKMLQKFAAHHSDVRIQQNPGGNNICRCYPQNPPHTFRASPIGIPRGKCF